MRCSQQNGTKSKSNSQKKSAKEFFVSYFCIFDWTRIEWPRKVIILSRTGKIHSSNTNLSQNVKMFLPSWWYDSYTYFAVLAWSVEIEYWSQHASSSGFRGQNLLLWIYYIQTLKVKSILIKITFRINNRTHSKHLELHPT